MSDTPRTDDREFAAIDLKPSSRVVYASFARQLETELAEAWAEIENKQYTITCASEENQQLKESLAEARSEIERLKLVSQNQETVIAAQRRSAKAKNELIEQMREALRAWVRTPEIPLHEAIKTTEAALEAAERGE